MNRVIIPIVNPIKFIPKTLNRPAQYNSVPFDLQSYYDRILDHWTKRGYCAKWQTTDAIRLQFRSNFDPIQLDLVDKYGISRLTVVMTRKQQDMYNPGYYLFEADMSLASVTPGHYNLEVKFGTGEDAETWTSEPLNIQTKHAHTTLLEYRGVIYDKDVIWLTGITFMMRIEGWLGKLKKGSEDQMWVDQPLNPKMINSRSFRVWPYNIGYTYGVPDWVYDKVTDIFGLDTVMIDGEQFVKAEANSEFDEKVIDGYPMAGYTVELRPSLNRSSLIIDITVDTTKKVAMVGNIETNLFGDVKNNGATNQVPVLNYE